MVSQRIDSLTTAKALADLREAVDDIRIERLSREPSHALIS